jgi:adenylate cyclase
MLFADVRGSTGMAENVSPIEFRHLMNRFFETTTGVLVNSGALIEKFIGDEVSAMYVPGFAGPEHPRRAVEAARKLLSATGHTKPGGPWIPVGVGVHSGIAFVGTVGSADGVNYITALGDAVNTAARLASQAGPGEIVVSESSMKAGGMALNDAEQRCLELKGRNEPVDVRVIRVAPG